MPYVITQCYLPPGRGDILAFTPATLVLDLATPEGCKAELTEDQSGLPSTRTFASGLPMTVNVTVN